MLTINNRNFSFSGTSSIENSSVASFNASSSSDNEIYFNFSILDLKLYNKNQSTVDADFVSFKNEVLKSLVPSEKVAEPDPAVAKKSQSLI